MSKQTIQIEISRTDYHVVSVPWLTGVIATALDGRSVSRIEIKTIKNK